MDLTRETVLGRTGAAVDVDVPRGWEIARPDEGPFAFVSRMPDAVAGPFADSLVVGVEPRPDGVPDGIEAVASMALLQLHASVPDLHLIDDRPALVDGFEGRFRALLQTVPGGITVVVRQLLAVADESLVTVALTSFPFRDRVLAPVAEEILTGVGIRPGTRPQEDR
ncbi:hypothetical protein [Brachybacterium hainanense]|uniref:DUF1795 domain-containing protein n=1 Tax=Brachybacterium hainanense TaxID=1541174 RepID=A0ABV6R6J3_9MICO